MKCCQARRDADTDEERPVVEIERHPGGNGEQPAPRSAAPRTRTMLSVVSVRAAAQGHDRQRVGRHRHRRSARATPSRRAAADMSSTPARPTPIAPHWRRHRSPSIGRTGLRPPGGAHEDRYVVASDDSRTAKMSSQHQHDSAPRIRCRAVHRLQAPSDPQQKKNGQQHEGSEVTPRRKATWIGP